MKALELIVYPKMGSVYYDDQANCTWSDSMVYGMSIEKRLTDAELAAEAFSAVFHEAECEVRGMRIERTFPKHPRVEYYVEQNHEFGRQADILHRFATLPHYDEPTP